MALYDVYSGITIKGVLFRRQPFVKRIVKAKYKYSSMNSFFGILMITTQ